MSECNIMYCLYIFFFLRPIFLIVNVQSYWMISLFLLLFCKLYSVILKQYRYELIQHFNLSLSKQSFQNHALIHFCCISPTKWSLFHARLMEREKRILSSHFSPVHLVHHEFLLLLCTSVGLSYSILQITFLYNPRSNLHKTSLIEGFNFLVYF